jgi:tripartite-type tricarboxylate transporter receptor subunit TctC
LPPKTPAPIVAAYREAFSKAVADPEFIAHGQTLTPGFSAISAADLTTAVKALAKVSPDAIHYMTKILNEEGLKVTEATEKKHS